MVEVNAAVHNNRRVFKNLATLYGAQLITGILSLIPIVFLPRYLGAVGMGQLTLALSFTGLFSALMITGTTVYIVREIARDHQRLSEIVSSGVALRAAMALALLPVAAAVLTLLRYPAETRTVVLIMYAAIAIRMISYTFAAALQALQDMTWRSAAVVAGEIVAVGVGWLVLQQGGGITGYVLVLVLADIIEFAVNVAYFVAIVPIKPAVRWHIVKQTFMGGMPFFLWAMLQTTYQQTSSLMLSKLGGEEAVGWFGTANQFIVPLFMIPSVAITVLLPQFSQLHVLEPAGLRRAVARSMQYMILITMPLAFGLSAIADRVINLFGYPATFQNSVPVLHLLAFNLPAAALLMVAGTAVAATNKERGWAKISLGSVVMAIVMNAVLIPSMERMLGNAAVGAAGATLLAELLTLALAIWLLGSTVIDRTLFVTLGKAGLAGAVMAAVVLSLAWAPLPLVIFTGGVVYGVTALWLNALPTEDLGSARRFAVRRWHAVTAALTDRRTR
jgi:O-antigen/teichoic acid export membrane protein